MKKTGSDRDARRQEEREKILESVRKRKREKECENYRLITQRSGGRRGIISQR